MLEEQRISADQKALDKHRRAWCAAMAKMAIVLRDNKDPWQHVTGPAAACIITLGRIGWDIPQHQGWKQWLDRKGEVIDLASMNPHELKKRLCTDIAVSLWSSSSINDTCQDKEGIWLEPLRHAVLRGSGENKLIGAMTRSAAIGNQWT